MKHREITFDGMKVCVKFKEDIITPLLDFLFCDIAGLDTFGSGETFNLDFEAKTQTWKLSHAEKTLYSGNSLSELGVILMGETLFHLIKNSKTGLAIHAGLVSDNEKTFLIPGNSGSGKSSVTTWLICNGLRYHTDELVSIHFENHKIMAFTRPINIKTNGVASIKPLFDFDSVIDQMRISPDVTMIPHRLINPDYRTEIPALTHIIFPKYIADCKPELSRLSGAEAGLEMMKSNVIARNLPQHGFFDSVSENVIDIIIDGRNTATMGHADMLRHLCHHTFEPCDFIKLGAVADIYGYATKFLKEINWNKISVEHLFVINTLRCLHFPTPLPTILAKQIDAPSGSGPQGVGQGFSTISSTLAARKPLIWKIRRIFLCPDWWLHIFYEVAPENSLINVKWVHHPFHLSRWFYRRFLANIKSHFNLASQ